MLPNEVSSWGFKKGNQYFSKMLNEGLMFLEEELAGNHTLYSVLGRDKEYFIENSEGQLVDIYTRENLADNLEILFGERKPLIFRKGAYRPRKFFPYNVGYFLNREKQKVLPFKHWRLMAGIGFSSVEFNSVEFPENNFITQSQSYQGNKYSLFLMRLNPVNKYGDLSLMYGGGVSVYEWSNYSKTIDEIRAVDINASYLSGAFYLEYGSLRGAFSPNVKLGISASALLQEENDIVRGVFEDDVLQWEFYEPEIGPNFIWGPSLGAGFDIPLFNREFSFGVEYSYLISVSEYKHILDDFSFNLSVML